MASDGAELHWCEGLFLQPHHFQYQQRYLASRLAAERAVAMPYDYGLIETEIFEEGLANKIIRFDKLQAVMPDGQYLRLGENTELEQLDIAADLDRASGSLMIWLALPVWSRDTSNVIENNSEAARREPRQFKLDHREWRDENSGDNAVDLVVRRYNAKLVAGAKPPNNFTSLPVLKLVRGTGQRLGQAVIDPTFIPTCLLSRGWRPLLAMAEEIAADAETNRATMARQMRAAGYHPDRMQPGHVMQILRLMVLGRYTARLSTLVKAPGCRPVELFMEMRSLLAEAHGLRPDLEANPTPEFDHDSPGPAFNELYLRIRQLLASNVEAQYREVPFVLKDRVLVAALQKEELTQPCEFMVAIDSPYDSKEVADFIEDRSRFKVMSPTTAIAAYPGVKMVEERGAIGLPLREKRHFFRLYMNADPQSTEMWKKILAEGSIVLNWRELEQHQQKKALVPTLYVVRSRAGT